MRKPPIDLAVQEQERKMPISFWKLWRRWRSTATSTYGEEMAAAKIWNEEATDLLRRVKSIPRTNVAQIERVSGSPVIARTEDRAPLSIISRQQGPAV